MTLKIVSKKRLIKMAKGNTPENGPSKTGNPSGGNRGNNSTASGKTSPPAPKK